VAYLTAVGDGAQPYERDGAGATLKEINDFSTVLATAIPAGDKETVALAIDTIGRELRELTEQYPDRKNTSVSGGERQRLLARNGLKDLSLRFGESTWPLQQGAMLMPRPSSGIIAI